MLCGLLVLKSLGELALAVNEPFCCCMKLYLSLLDTFEIVSCHVLRDDYSGGTIYAPLAGLLCPITELRPVYLGGLSSRMAKS